MSQLLRLKKQEFELEMLLEETRNLRDYYEDALDKGYTAEWSASECERAPEVYEKLRCEAIDRSKALSELRAKIQVSRKTEYDRLTEKGKNQAAEILSAMYAAPGKETSDYAQATGLNVRRVRFLARVMARADMVIRTGHSRWNGMYYGKYFTYRPYNPKTDDLPF